MLAANNYGLHDMAGNLREWCWDWDPGHVGSDRVLRGGNWSYYAEDCRSASRYGGYPGDRSYYGGFRVCFPAPESGIVSLDFRDYTLTVASAHATPTPAVGPHTYAWHATVTCTVTDASSTHDPTGWTGTGSVPATGTALTTGALLLDEVGGSTASSIAWEWSEAPAADDDAYTTPEDTPLTVIAPGVLANDTDAEDDPLTAAKLTDPAHGTVTLQADGSFVYTPAAEYSGTDSFTYKANDGHGDSAPATVTFTVSPTNDPPTNTVLPTVTGTTMVGSVLTADKGTWNDGIDTTPGALSYTYQWRRADDGVGTNAADIAGATDAAYTLQNGDAGAYVAVRVTAKDNGEGTPAIQSMAAESVWTSIPRWGLAPGNPIQGVWTIYLESATLQPTGGTAAVLTAGDEIAVFQGDRQVGWTTLTASLDGGFDVYVKAFAELGDGSTGYEPGEPYEIRCWDISERIESAKFIGTYPKPGEYEGTVFPAGGSAVSAMDLVFYEDATPPEITISAPSVDLTASGPVTYTVTYADAGTLTVTLATGDITLVKTGTADATVAVSGSRDGATRTITLSDTVGDGTLAIEVTADTAEDDSHNLAPATGPSATFTVDNTDPVIAVDPAVVYLTVDDAAPDRLAGVTATDTNDGDVTADVAATGTVNTAVEGDYTVLYDVDDATGNAAAQASRLYRVFPTPHWTFSPGNAAEAIWTIYVESAKLDGAALTEKDEIAVYQDTLLVGWTVLTGPLDGGMDVHVKAYAELNDGSTGYVAGQPYQLKCWDNSTGAGDNVCEVVYPIAGHYEGSLFPSGTSPHSVMDLGFRTTLVLRPQMRLGFQILSAPFGPLPNPDMLVLFADHTDKIEYVRNQDADQVKYSFGQWRNNVGDWKATEAYLVKIPMDAEFEDEDAILVLEGVPVPVDTAIPLRAGFSFVPYLPDYPLAAAEAFAEILDDLDYVRDSEGNQLKFSFGQWRDNIGALQRGQGYLVKMKSPVAGFQYPGPTRRSVRTVPTACESRATTHWPFTPGNPTSDIWTIFLESATLDGTNLGAGDEIAIFQSDRLVGTTVLDGELDGGMDVSVKAFAELSDGSAGYVPGETYDIRCWRASSDTESTVFAVAYALPGGYEGTAFPSGDSAESAMDLTFTTPAPALIVTETGGTTAVQEGGATDTVSVRLATQPTGSVTVTATFGTDTEPGTRRAGTTVLTFTVGNWQTDQPLTVKAIEDAVIEGPEAEQLGLAAAGAGYAGITATVDVDVEDNDEASVAFTAATGRVGEDAEHAVCAVLSLPAGSTLAIDLTVDVAITGGTATADVDYTDWTAQSRTLIFPAGSVDGRTETAPLQTLPDAEAEADETITFEFASPSAALAVGEPATYALTIDEFGVDDAWLWILSGAACEKPTYSFGMHPDALDDSTLDDLDAPYVPGVPVDADPAIPADERAICRFALDPANPVADTRQRDIHASDEDGSTWYLVVSPSLTAGSSLAWSVPDGFPTDWTASLVEVDGDGTPMGSRAVIDMRVATELPIEADPAGAMRYFMIVCAAPEETCDLTLEPGWNLVSLPIEPTNPEVGSIFDEARVLTSARGAFRDGMSGAVVHAGTVWIWADSDGDGVYGYEATTQLHAGQGAWAFLDDAEAVTLRVGGARVANPEVLLHYGWNLIGTGTAESSVPGNAPVWDAVFLWDPLTLRYLIVDLLSPGYGHWLHCTAASYTLPLANE